MNENNIVEETPKEPAIAATPKKLVGVQFSAAGRIYSFDPAGIDVKKYDYVVVDGDKGPSVGVAITNCFEVTKNTPHNVCKVLEKASVEDIGRFRINREQAMKAFNVCRSKIVEHGLTMMKLVDVDTLPDNSKAIFYFTSEERVDFRGLVKDLAGYLHMRIEMRQIGARDASKCIGAIGTCGQICCCKKYLRDFKSISIQMAKNQGLSPNPAKLTGMCGKLKCCLSYENEMYSELKENLPPVGSEVDTKEGKGVINNLDVPRQLIYVYLEETNKEACFKLDDITVLKRKEPRKRSSSTRKG